LNQNTPRPEFGSRHFQAARLGISTTTFDRLTKNPAFPKPIKALVGKPLFSNKAVDDALRLISDENQREAA